MEHAENVAANMQAANTTPGIQTHIAPRETIAFSVLHLILQTVVNQNFRRLIGYRQARIYAACAAVVVQAEAADQAERVTFSDHIAPILQNHCAECHFPGGVGPFSLVTYDQVRKRARQIAEVTSTRYMPPWKPDPAYGPPIQGKNILTDEEVDLIERWYESGAPVGDKERTILAPADAGAWQLGEPDVILQPDEPFVLPPGGDDVYRNLVISVGLDRTRFVRAVEFRPETKLAVHHALITIDASPWSREKDAADPGPGFSGMALGNADNPSGYIIGWAPGSVPFEAHPDAPFPLKPGVDLVLRLHLLPTGRQEQIQPMIGLYFSDHPPTKQTAFLHLSAPKIEIPAGEAFYTIEESLTLPVAVRLLSTFPHAHYLGKDLRFFAVLPDGTQQPLLRIPDWDFNWQRDYRYVEPVPLPAETRLIMRYVYDNSAANPRNPFDPPRHVSLGWRSSDEMGEIVVSVLLADPADAPRIKQAQSAYMRKSMGEANYQLLLGTEYFEAGNLDRAREAFAAALAEDPSFVPAAINLGKVAHQQGDHASARKWLGRAYEMDRDNETALIALYSFLRDQERVQEGERTLAAHLREFPQHEKTRIILVDRLLSEGRARDAAEQIMLGLEIAPGSAPLNFRMGILYSEIDQPELAERHLLLAANASGSDADTLAVRADANLALSMLSKKTNRRPDPRRNSSSSLPGEQPEDRASSRRIPPARDGSIKVEP